MENRDTFLARLHELPGSAVFTSEEVARMELAYDLGKYALRGQERRNGLRAFEHARRATLIALDELQLYDPELIMTLLGHDWLEDSPRYVSPEKIRIVCGSSVERRIKLLSKTEARKPTYVAELRAHGDWKTLLAKACDRLDNLRDLPSGDDEESAAFRRKQILETRDAYLGLFEHLVSIAPVEHGAKCRKALDSIREIVDAQAAALNLTPAPL